MLQILWGWKGDGVGLVGGEDGGLEVGSLGVFGVDRSLLDPSFFCDKT